MKPMLLGHGGTTPVADLTSECAVPHFVIFGHWRTIVLSDIHRIIG